MANAPKRNQALWAIGLLLIAGCTATPTPSSTPSATPTATVAPSSTLQLSTHVGVISRATLPPTWTPTRTPTPSRTPPPSPLPPTATVAVAPALTELCDSIYLHYEFADGEVFNPDQTLTFLFGTTFTRVSVPEADAPVDFKLRWLAINEKTGNNLGADVLPGQIVGVEIPASELSDPGVYRWTLKVIGEPFGEACSHTGTFTIAAADLTPEVTVAVSDQ